MDLSLFLLKIKKSRPGKGRDVLAIPPSFRRTRPQSRICMREWIGAIGGTQQRTCSYAVRVTADVPSSLTLRREVRLKLLRDDIAPGGKDRLAANADSLGNAYPAYGFPSSNVEIWFLLLYPWRKLLSTSGQQLPFCLLVRVGKLRELTGHACFPYINLTSRPHNECKKIVVLQRPHGTFGLGTRGGRGFIRV